MLNICGSREVGGRAATQSVMRSVMQPFIRRMGDLTLHALYWMDRVSGNTHGIPREAMRQDPY